MKRHTGHWVRKAVGALGVSVLATIFLGAGMDGPAPATAAPAQVAPPTAPQVDAGRSHSCGVRADGAAACWGRNQLGQASPPGGAFTQVTTGADHTCGIRVDGSITCWGANGVGELNSPSGGFLQVDGGGAFTCAIGTNQTVDCWGIDINGQSSPPSGSFTQITAGSFHACALRTDDSVACWGADAVGQASPPPGPFRNVSAGSGHSCGVRDDGTVACWGRNTDGETNAPSGQFVDVRAARGTYSCGLRTDGHVQCWGSNFVGESSPPNVAFSQIALGEFHGCGVTVAGPTRCWGRNSSGEVLPGIGVSVPVGAVGVPYSGTLTTTHMAPSATFAVVADHLPTGLSLSPSGSITGTPTESENALPRFEATNGLSPIVTRDVIMQIHRGPTETVVSSTGDPSTYGDAVTFTATVSSGAGTPTGTVTVTGCDDPVPLDALGQAACTPGPLPAGTHTIAAEYGGDTDYEPSSGEHDEVVDPALLTVTPKDQVRFVDTANPELTVDYDGFVLGETLGTSDVTGESACTTTALPDSPPGQYPITCTAGSLASRNYAFQFVEGTLTVNARATTHLVARPVSAVRSLLTLRVTYQATLTSATTAQPLAGRTVRFAHGGTGCSAVTNADGVASCSVSVLNILAVLLGQPYGASFAGDESYGPSAATGASTLI